MSYIEPINLHQQQQVIDRVAELLLQCEKKFARPFKTINIYFDLSGRTSGMYVVRNKQKYLRFNPFIFAKYFEESLATTVPHEVAHYISDVFYDIKHIRPHGKEWRSIMFSLGVEPEVTGNYDLAGVPVKRQRRFDYQCNCMSHQLTTTRHNKVINRKAVYCCQKCGAALTPQASLECG